MVEALAYEAPGIERGFASQRVFRALMDALARPGIIQDFPGQPDAPPPLTPGLASIILALADHETPIWLNAQLRNFPPVLDWLRFHTGAPFTDNPAEATFAFAGAMQVLPGLADFAQGTDEYPDRSTTLVMAISGLEAGARLQLRGPGIAGDAVITPAGLPQGFVRQWHENRARFPRGVDVILVAGEQVVGLPRSTRISTEPV